MLSHVLQNLTHPLSVAIFLLLAALLLWRRAAWGRLFCLAALCLILVFSSPITASALLGTLENQNPDAPVESLPRAQAIVVLGGSVHIPNGYHTDLGLLEGSDRERRAVRLYKAGKAPLVVASGGSRPVPGARPIMPESRVMTALMQEWGVPPSATVVEDRSLNTRENALFTWNVLQPKNIRRILLVTSASHMPRAAAAFRKAGFDVVPAPADFQTGWTSLEQPLDWFPSADALTKSDMALKEWIGLQIYRLRGWI